MNWFFLILVAAAGSASLTMQAGASEKESAFISGTKITYQEFRKDYKKGSVLIPGKNYTLYACVDGTVQLPFYKGVLSAHYYVGSSCYSPEQLYISHDDGLGLQKAFEFRHTKGMEWVTVSVNVDGGIAIVDFKR